MATPDEMVKTTSAVRMGGSRWSRKAVAMTRMTGVKALSLRRIHHERVSESVYYVCMYVCTYVSPNKRSTHIWTNDTLRLRYLHHSSSSTKKERGKQGSTVNSV
jgi:hypothetical protein